MHIAESKKTVWKGCIVYISNVWHSGTGKAKDTMKRSLVSSSLWRGRNRWSAGDIQDGETTLYDTVMVPTWHASFKSHRTIHKGWTLTVVFS